MIAIYEALEIDCPLKLPQRTEPLIRKPNPTKKHSKKRAFTAIQSEPSKQSHVDPRLRKEQLRVETLKKKVQNTPSILASSIEFMTVQHRVSKSRGQQLTYMVAKRKYLV